MARFQRSLLALTSVMFGIVMTCFVYRTFRDELPLGLKMQVLKEEVESGWVNTIQPEDDNTFHIIITFRLISSKESPLAGVRMKEYMDSLQANLRNKHLKKMHLMFDTSEISEYIQEHLGAHPKLVLHQVKTPNIVLTLHQFAYTHLQGQVVVITQADIVLGEGFETISGRVLGENKVMYSLSRHIGNNCPYDVDRCKHYVGSHDTFVFVPRGHINPEAMKLLDHHVYRLGTERVIMHVYRKLLNFTVLNPCWVFRVYHNHCSNYRKYTTKTETRLDHVYKDMSWPTNRTM